VISVIYFLCVTTHFFSFLFFVLPKIFFVCGDTFVILLNVVFSPTLQQKLSSSLSLLHAAGVIYAGDAYLNSPGLTEFKTRIFLI